MKARNFYCRELSEKDDLSSVAEDLIPGSDLLAALANCRELCRFNFHTIRNARLTDSRLARYFQAVRDEIAIALLAGAYPLEVGDVAGLRGIAAGDVKWPKPLLSAAAFLSAGSQSAATSLRERKRWKSVYEPVTASPAFGGASLSITPVSPGAIRAAFPADKAEPRVEFEMADDVRAYHPELHIEPMKVETWSISPRMLPPRCHDLLDRRMLEQQVRIAMASLTSDAEISVHLIPGFPGNEPSRFVVTGTGNIASQERELQSVLERCRDQGVSILVLPELRMPPALDGQLKRFLRAQQASDLLSGRGLILVAAGSWHVEVDEGRAHVNRCELLDYRGEVVWSHHKMAEYRIAPGEESHGSSECIRVGSHLEFCDSPWGRIAVSICVGFFHPPLLPLIEASRADLFLVPAMTKRVRQLQETASRLVGTQFAASFIANCGKTGGTEERSFFHTPFAQGPVSAADSLHVFDLYDKNISIVK